jgi:hypothetical protein
MGGRKMPRWAIQPFRDFLNHTQEVVQLAHVSARGLSMLRGAPELMEAVQKLKLTKLSYPRVSATSAQKKKPNALNRLGKRRS